jgi:uncharacterized protein YbjT (DUF2867 family)
MPPTMKNAITVLAGATGNLGGRIATALLERGASVRAIVRRGSAPDKIEALRRRGAAIAEGERRARRIGGTRLTRRTGLS